MTLLNLFMLQFECFFFLKTTRMNNSSGGINRAERSGELTFSTVGIRKSVSSLTIYGLRRKKTLLFLFFFSPSSTSFPGDRMQRPRDSVDI